MPVRPSVPTENVRPRAVPAPDAVPHAVARAPVDIAVLDDLRCDLGSVEPDAIVCDLLRIFLDSAASHIARIDALAQQRDAAAVAFEAHGLKGAAATMGAHRLAEVACLLEEAEHATAPVGADALVADLKAEFRLVAAWCAEHFPDSSKSPAPSRPAAS